MHSSAVLSLLVLFFAKPQLVRVWRETTVGTPAGEVWLRLNACFFSLEDQEQKARASRSRAPFLNTITILRDRVVCQHINTIARREQDAPPPSIGCGLPGPYGGTVVFTENLVRRMTDNVYVALSNRVRTSRERAKRRAGRRIMLPGPMPSTRLAL